MPMSAEEIIRIEKDKDLDLRFKSVKQAIRLNVTRHLSEANGGNLLKYVSTYSCDMSKLVESEIQPNDRAKLVLSSLNTLGTALEDVFSDIGDAKEGILAHALSTKATVKLDKVSTMCRAVKVNFYPSYVEKYSLGMSDEMEAKMIVPRSTFRAIKTLVDRYYFMFRIVSINATCRTVFNSISYFRDQLHTFEWNIFHYLKEIQGEYLRESGNYSREIKTTLLNMKKLLEAMDSSNFARLVYVLQDITRENGMRIFAKHNSLITILSNDQFKGQQIELAKILEVYDVQFKPIHKIVSGISHAKKGVALRMVGNNDERLIAWRAISPLFPAFCDGMKFIMSEFEKVMTVRTDDYKFFKHTLETNIFPYFNTARGEINDMFVTSVKNIETFFWKLMILVTERSLEQDISLDEVFGLIVKVTKEDYKKYSAALPDTSDVETEDSEEEESKDVKATGTNR